MDTERRIAVLKGQNAILERIARGASLENSLCRIASTIESLLEGAVCAIALCHTEDGCLRCIAAPNLPDGLRGVVAEAPIGRGKWPGATAASRGEAVVIPEIDADPVWAGFHDIAEAVGFRACWSLPILSQTAEVLGTIDLYYREPYTPGDDDYQIIDVLLPLARIAIEHDQRAQALHLAEKRFGSLAANLPGVVYQRVVSPDGDIRYTFISEGARDLFGVSPTEIVADPQALFDCHGPEYSRTFRKRLLSASRELSLWDVEAPIVTAKGENKWTHAIARPQRQPDGSVVWDGIILDATRIKHAEQALRESRGIMRAVMDAIPAEIYAKDRELRYVFINDCHASHIGLSPNEAVGKTDAEILGKDLDDENTRRERDVFVSGKPIPYFEEEHADKEGSRRRWLTTKVPLKDEKGAVNSVVTVSLDITDFKRVKRKRKQLERQLQQAQKMEAVGQLTGGIAHDFNNILAVIRGNLELLDETLEGDDEQCDLIGEAIGAADRAGALTHRLLAFSRKQALQPRLTDLNGLVSGMINLMAPTLGEMIEIEASLCSDVRPVLVDPGQLESAILNLAVNARDAMPNGGKLLVETANVTIDGDFAAEFDDLGPGQYTVLAVTDTGAGMTADVLDRVFEPFFTTKDVGQGSGLGLSMVFGFVKQSGGHVRVYSEPGHGTAVKIYLPSTSADEAVAEDATQTMEIEHRGNGEKILVVEDAPDVRRYAVRLLSRLGYSPVSATNGREALELLDQSSDIDLVFTDVVLPDGMSGVDLVREIHLRNAGLKVLYTSGYTENAIVHHDRLHENVELITKPYRKVDLARKLRSILDRASA
ncbi:MAG: ATP-binding protein [Alphaproteobacteria bacterium]